MNKALEELKSLVGFKDLKQPKNGINIRSLEETRKEWERCFRKMGFIMLDDEKVQKSEPL